MAIPTSDMPEHQALHDRVCRALDICLESPGADFKGSADWRALQFEIIKTALAMVNLRDGGVIVISAGERGADL